jgi:hypothetical protein
MPNPWESAPIVDDEPWANAPVVDDDSRQMPPAKDKIDPLSAMRHTIPQPASQPFAKAEKTGLPMVWDVKLGQGEYGPTVRAVRDDKAGGYVFQDDRNPTKWNLVVRRADGSLTSRPLDLYNPTESMGAMRTAAAGAGKAIMDTGRGIGQLGRKVGNIAGAVSDADMQKSYDREAEIRAQDEALMGRTAGKVGYVGGQIATMVTPGVMAKGAGLAAQAANAPKVASAVDAAGNAILAPTTYKGAAALGAATGAVQPVTSESERLTNVGVGALGGVAGQAIGNVAARGMSALKSARTANMPAEPEKQLSKEVYQILMDNRIDVGKMSRQALDGLQAAVDNASDQLTPAAIARIARAQSLEYPVTLSKGSALGSFDVKKRESLLMNTAGAGQPLRDLAAENNQQLTKNLASLAERQGGKETAMHTMGQSVQEALKSGSKASLDRVSEMYRKASASGLGNEIDSTPIVNGLLKNIDAIKANNDAGPAMQLAYTLQRLGAVTIDADRNIVATGKPIPAEVAMELYKAANKSFKPGSVSSMHIADVKRGILDAMDSVQAGPEYRQAVRAFRQHAATYDDPKLVSSLLKVGAGDEPAVAAEKVFNRVVLNGSLNDINNLKSVMLRSDRKVRDQGIQALRNMRAGLVNYIQEEALAGKAVNEIGQPIISGNNLIGAVRRIGGGSSPRNEELGWLKVRAVLGPKATNQLKNIAQVALDTTREVAGSGKSSGTAENLMSILGSIPIAGGPTQAIIGAGTEAVRNQVKKKEAEQLTNAVADMMKKKVRTGGALTGSALSTAGGD